MNNVRYFRKKCNLSQDELAEKLGVKGSAISKYECDRVPLPQDMISKLCIIFGCTADELLGIKPINATMLGATITMLDDPTNNIKNVPVFNEIKYTDDLSGGNNVDFYFPVAASRYKSNNQLFAKRITTSQMYPRIMKGDLLIFEAITLGVDMIYDGDICLVSKGDDNAVAREMVVVDNGFVFNPYNTDMPPTYYSAEKIRRENINIIGRALKLVHEFPRRGQ